MDTFESKAPGEDQPSEPIPFDDKESGNEHISSSPLHIGNSTGQPPESAKPAGISQTEKTASEERITGVKTFFTKLHAGAIDFLDGQINSWLKENPDVVVKRTSTVTGDVVGKKTEPNIIVTIWY